ncbi:MAG: hypothetical protein J5J06_06255 [Phycisphaerae bacterium]|nr:hypothetical protein [Phycisphaerae bacterium]
MSTAPVDSPRGEWQRLVAAAVLGMDRLGTNLPTIGGPAGALVDAATADDVATKLLNAVAVLGPYELAGRSPASLSRTLEVPPPEDAPECSLRAGQQLFQILEGEYGMLLEEWCQLAAQMGVRIPDEQLPRFLDRSLAALDDSVFNQVLRQRGRWLARQHPRWRRLVQEDNAAEIWRTGDPEDRLIALARLRRCDPNAGRSLVAETWPQESPDDRPKILRQLAIGLSEADEAFLESTLDDKRKSVRSIASDLLARLPSSGYANRMLQRARAMVNFQVRKGLIRGKQVLVDVTPPNSIDAALNRDGVENKSQHGMGNKASVLCQVLAGAELEAWRSGANLEPEELVRAAAASDWKAPILRGWCRAAIRQGNEEWAIALLRVCADHADALEGEELEALAGCAGSSMRELLVLELLGSRANLRDPPLLALLAGSDHAWSTQLSRAVLKALRQYLCTDTAMYDHTLRKLVTQQFARRMNPAFAEEAATGWNRNTSAWNKGHDEMVDKLAATLMFRRAMQEELRSDEG